jgi:hypothetical protein
LLAEFVAQSAARFVFVDFDDVVAGDSVVWNIVDVLFDDTRIKRKYTDLAIYLRK